MKILIYGAGPLGSLFAARLHDAGQDVAILARGQRLAELREYGIVLEDATTGARSTRYIPVVEQLAPDDSYDLVAVVMRKNQVRPILPALAANRPTPTVLFLGNNAAGPDEYVRALGHERVLMGFGGAGGMRAGHSVRYIAEARGKKANVTLGEMDGKVTPRLQEIAGAFESASFHAVLSPNVDAWLKSHAAVVCPVALALYMADGDNYRLARTPDALALLIRAARENFRVLRALNVPLTPAALRIYEWIPTSFLVAMLRRTLNTREAEIAIAGHANAARDEMRLLADELRSLARSTTVPTPAADRLYEYLDPLASVAGPASTR